MTTSCLHCQEPIFFVRRGGKNYWVHDRKPSIRAKWCDPNTTPYQDAEPDPKTLQRGIDDGPQGAIVGKYRIVNAGGYQP